MPSKSAPVVSDVLTRFLLQHAGVRGVRVHLHDSWGEIRQRSEYSDTTAELLGEAVVAAALFTGHTKIDGRLSVQLRSDGPLRSLFAECTGAGTLRGIAQVGGTGQVSRDLRRLGPGAIMAITIENPGANGREPGRYQGIVPLEAESLMEAFEDYFRQSEQLPTRLLLAVDGEAAAGLMLQKLPGDQGDDDGWTRATTLFDTLSAAELLAWPADTLLLRLFHEDGVEVLGERPLRFGCSCSRERVQDVLVSLGETEAHASVQEGRHAEIRCQFCGHSYQFTARDIDALFTASSAGLVVPDSLQ
ncbi:MAG: Hsp33 family molecular chaperone HslO [Pseudomonadota bacterium]|nr:Hsp33 family molecular chaperone HslO [Pseudomonadota bacterium]